MTALDWGVLFATLTAFAAYGLWRGRGTRDLSGYVLAGRSLRWPTVALSVMATQASAITFLSTPGQGYADGLRFVQFYFGLPLAMIVLCVTVVPAYHRMKVFTAYEYLEGRFGPHTRTLAASLFLIQRGLAAGLGIYAPSLVLSVLMGWDVRWTCALIGGLVVLYTGWGGSKAVGHSHALQFVIIIGTMIVAFALAMRSLPHGVGFRDAVAIASRLGRMRAVDTRFNLNERYNLWSGLIGGFFLQLSYFGTDQSQVGRYLGGQSVRQSRLGLLFNGFFKVPMQFAILLLGVMVFVFYEFAPSPLFFNPVESHRMETSAHRLEWQALEARHRATEASAREAARALVAARRVPNREAAQAAGDALERAQKASEATRKGAVQLMQQDDPKAQTSDTNYVFLMFVLAVLPAGLVGLVLAAMFAASMNSTSSELNALASTSMVDVFRRIWPHANPAYDVRISRLLMVAWTGFALVFAEYASRLGSLIEAVNILGSLFYGTILGIFLTAFYLKRVGGSAVFIAALLGETAVVACFHYTKISFLWYNVVGCVLVMALGLALSVVLPRHVAPAPAAV
jgi:solute:Na+ symporter, SSS family